MCGIYTTFSDKPITSSKFLVSLKDLEYRGYDSAGITFFSGSKYKTFKTLKKISDLQIKVPKTEKSKKSISLKFRKKTKKCAKFQPHIHIRTPWKKKTSEIFRKKKTLSPHKIHE